MIPAFRVEDLVFSYGGSPVLAIDRLEIPAGEIVALVGPNGSGKTTLLHVLAFLQTPDRGTLSFFGDRFSNEKLLSFRRRVGLLLQSPYLFRTSVLANVVWGLRLRGMSAKKSRGVAAAALDLVGLSGFEHRHARSLSGGEAQRVALARALALEPDVLLLDEPASHMDRDSIKRTEQVVLNLNKRHGKTVVWTSHDVARVQALSHRVLHLFQGKMVPASPDNLFRGNLCRQGTFFDTGQILVQLPKPLNTGSYMTIDPSKITVSQNSAGDNIQNSFKGTIVALSADNGQIRVEVEAGERFRVVLKADGSDLPYLQLGRQVYVTFSGSAITVF